MLTHHDGVLSLCIMNLLIDSLSGFDTTCPCCQPPDPSSSMIFLVRNHLLWTYAVSSLSDHLLLKSGSLLLIR
jgi:hypothetical protein